MWPLYPYRDEGRIAETEFDLEQTAYTDSYFGAKIIVLNRISTTVFTLIFERTALRGYNVGVSLNTETSFALFDISRFILVRKSCACCRFLKEKKK